MTMPPWSYSSLTSFETCAKRYYHIKVIKDVLDTPGEAARWGSTVHKHLEDRVRDNAPLPEAIRAYEPLVDKIASAPGTKLIEYQMAVDRDLRPTTWTSDEAWCRGIVDIGLLTGKRALLLDWKTGKRKPDSTQLKLFAGLAFSHFPNVEEIKTGFVWLQVNKVDKATFTPDHVPSIWQEFVPRVARLERAYDEGKFLPRPSGLCKAHCPVPKHLCEFSGRT